MFCLHAWICCSKSEVCHFNGLNQIWLRTQRVHINGSFSSPQDFSFDVPRGSCLGLQLFLAYMLPLGNIIRKYGMELQMYADLCFCLPGHTMDEVKCC